MNYLAHIYLSYGLDDILVGNFAADFLTNNQAKQLTEPQMNGVLLHRMIDAFTDMHPIVRNSTKRLRVLQGKYAPVVIDIIYDYLLAKNWPLFSSISLEEFKNSNYKMLLANLDAFPERSRTKVLGMVNGDFISSYQSLEGMNFVFERMDRRTRFPSRFVDATAQLRKDEDLFTEEFLRFFPLMEEKAKAFLTGLSLMKAQ